MSKKLTLILAFIGMIGLTTACSNEDDIDNDTIAEAFELRNVNFDFNPADGYTIYRALNPQIFASDVILIYRLAGTIDSSTPIWQQIPRTLYLPEGELDYDFDFSKEDFTIYAGGTYDLATTPTYITNETFRIVIVPAYLSNKGASQVDFSDYNAVIKAYNIDESKIKIMK
ncbi:hypothetical protein B0A61_11800 [Flavobacterium aquatile LMG 4008 = ATCC 11947]|uniref:Dihydrolipoamide dehydrogenase n=2 Tax=Flavobacterium aquatile TaxID=245 RepID=A0A095U267_9FLAO|nr:hypothetical protein LG45_03205 [Flavobacterium aquatile LMG 4008 = ATCC 11947]OXA66429.1 hypothetical protein B0A61_11800 [Flavobacterium aquatile LMG 4008 = ATCC 11947]